MRTRAVGHSVHHQLSISHFHTFQLLQYIRNAADLDATTTTDVPLIPVRACSSPFFFQDSIEAAGLDIKVTIGLRETSPSWAEAEATGFSKAEGTLGEVFDVVADADMVVLLISDAAQVWVHTVPPLVPTMYFVAIGLSKVWIHMWPFMQRHLWGQKRIDG